VNLFYQPGIPEGIHHLDAEESRHCIRVLRKKAGETIRITDGKGVTYEGVITDADPHHCSFSIRQTIPAPPLPYSIHIAIAPTKNADRIEWFVEKTVELGIGEITPLVCHNSERSNLKVHRLQKVALSAMKQSLKSTLPVIHPLTDFADLVTRPASGPRFIAYVDSQNPDHLQRVAERGKNYLVLIGPEGDFTPEELVLAQSGGFRMVSLGTSRLRTETAGLAACHILNLINV
jgi:16S rRNA (uracil1498-N3)-methyltransferase